MMSNIMSTTVSTMSIMMSIHNVKSCVNVSGKRVFWSVVVVVVIVQVCVCVDRGGKSPHFYSLSESNAQRSLQSCFPFPLPLPESIPVSVVRALLDSQMLSRSRSTSASVVMVFVFARKMPLLMIVVTAYFGHRCCWCFCL
jgi:hypothetical protein